MTKEMKMKTNMTFPLLYIFKQFPEVTLLRKKSHLVKITSSSSSGTVSFKVIPSSKKLRYRLTEENNLLRGFSDIGSPCPRCLSSLPGMYTPDACALQPHSGPSPYSFLENPLKSFPCSPSQWPTVPCPLRVSLPTLPAVLDIES